MRFNDVTAKPSLFLEVGWEVRGRKKKNLDRIEFVQRYRQIRIEANIYNDFIMAYMQMTTTLYTLLLKSNTTLFTLCSSNNLNASFALSIEVL